VTKYNKNLTFKIQCAIILLGLILVAHFNIPKEKETKHGRSVWGLSRVCGDLRMSAYRCDVLPPEQGVGIPQVGGDYDHCLDLALHPNHRLHLWTLCAGNLPSGALFVPEADFDPQTRSADSPTLQLTRVQLRAREEMGI
jgi:hypothetical protein